MLKTADEIKKGLECCIESTCEPCCPYGNVENCKFSIYLLEDALAYIRQLEKDKDDLLEERELNDYLRDRVKQLEAERDAAVRDANKCCETCKNSYLNDPKIDICRHFMLCQSASMWEWRGVQKEE